MNVAFFVVSPFLPIASLVICNLGLYLISSLSYLHRVNYNTTSWSTRQPQRKQKNQTQSEQRNEGGREPNRKEQMLSGIIINVLCRSFVILIAASIFLGLHFGFVRLFGVVFDVVVFICFTLLPFNIFFSSLPFNI